MIVAINQKLYTAADLIRLPHDQKRYALVAGELLEMSPTGKSHGLLTSELSYRLIAFVRQHDLGQVYGAETGFKLTENPDTVYGIDAAFVSKARAQRGEDYFMGAPDLAIEVVSPGNTQIEMHDKVSAYFRAGAWLVWIVYPKSRAIYVYQAANEVRILTSGETLDGGAVLPGFALQIGDLFAVLDP